MKFLKEIYQIHSNIVALLNSTEKKKLRIIKLLSALIALADIIGISSMVPVLMLAIDYSFLEKSSKLRYVYNLFQFNSEKHFLIFLIIFIVLFFIVKNICAIILQKYIRKVALELTENLTQKNYFYQFQFSGYLQKSKHGLGFNDALLFNPYYFVAGCFLPVINLFAEIMVVVMLILVFTLYKPAVLILIVGVLGSAFFFVNRYMRKRMTNLGKMHAQYRDKSLQEINYGLSGFIDIKTFFAENYFYQNFKNSFVPFANSGLKVNTYQNMPNRINEFVALLGLIGLVIYAYFFTADNNDVIQSKSNLAEIRVVAALFVIVVFRLIPATNRMMQAISNIKLNAYTIDELSHLKNIDKKVNEKIQQFTSLELKKLVFSYADKIILDQISFEINKGEILGIKGESGIGKSTLLKLIIGLLKPKSGEIIFNKTPNVSVKIGHLGQEIFLFNSTVLNNVIFGHQNLDIQKAKDCIVAAALCTPSQAETWLSKEAGVNGGLLSAGQKQRIGIARALYHDTDLFLFDEPTSSLDEDTEKELIENIKHLKNNDKAVIIVAHRPKIFEICSQVVEITTNGISTFQ